MRLSKGLIILLPLLFCGAQGQGFFSGFNNFVSMVNRFNPLRNVFPSRPAPSRPAPSFSSAPSRPAPTFSSGPARPAPSFSSAPAPAPPPATFSRPVITSITRPEPAPIPAVSSNSVQTSQQLNIAPAPAPSPAPAPPRPSSGGRGNHQWNGRDYLLSWREGQNGLSWSQVVSDRAPYFWAGGRLSNDKRTLTWENGRSEGIRKGQHPWSFTGNCHRLSLN